MTELMFEREKKLLEFYSKQEIEIESKLRRLSTRFHSIDFESKKRISNIQAEKKGYQKRNELLLKSFQVATAKLRTQFFFCPTDRGLEKAKKKYIETLQETQSNKHIELDHKMSELFI